jgi:hypothetical protein
MEESKIELTERLRAEGRWSEAARYKDEIVRALRGEGMKRGAAGEEAWRRMAEKYPPQPAPVPCDDGDGGEGSPVVVSAEEKIDIGQLLERIGDERPDLVRDTLWVYDHLVDDGTKPSDAPTAGAWALLRWARRYQNRFFEMVLPKAMNARSQDDEDAANIRRERMAIEEVQKLLAEMRPDVSDVRAGN